MALEEFPFMGKGILDRLARINIALTTVNDGNVTKPQRDDSACEDVYDIRAGVHQIDFREHTNGTGS